MASSTRAIPETLITRAVLSQIVAKLAGGGVSYLLAGAQGGKKVALHQIAAVLQNKAQLVFVTAYSYSQDLLEAAKLGGSCILVAGTSNFDPTEQFVLNELAAWLAMRYGCPIVIAYSLPPMELERAVWLPPFSLEEMLQLARTRYSGPRVRQIAQEVHRLTGGHPYLAQILLAQPGLTSQDGPRKAWEEVLRTHPFVLELGHWASELKELLISAASSAITLAQLVHAAQTDEKIRKLFQLGLIGGPPHPDGRARLLIAHLAGVPLASRDPWVWTSVSRQWSHQPIEKVFKLLQQGLVIDLRDVPTVYAYGRKVCADDARAALLAAVALNQTQGMPGVSRQSLAAQLHITCDALRRHLHNLRRALGKYATWVVATYDHIALNAPFIIIAPPGLSPP